MRLLGRTQRSAALVSNKPLNENQMIVQKNIEIEIWGAFFWNL